MEVLGKYPSAQTVETILKTAVIMNGISVEEIPGDSYVDLLFKLDVFETVGGDFHIKQEYSALCSEDKNQAFAAFKEIISSLPEYNLIISSIGSGCNLQAIQKKLDRKVAVEDVFLFLSWMEQLQVIVYKKGIYSPNDTITEDDDDFVDTVYPLDINTEINIKPGEYSVFEYLRKIKNNRIVTNPDFQRNEVWKDTQKSMFIESTMLNIPIPPLYFRAGQKGELIVVDGLQRTSALRDFFDNKLTLTGLRGIKDLNGYNYNALIADEKKKFLVSKVEDKMLPFYELSFETPMSVVYDIFNRINTGGTKLERQEIRNCIYIGHSTKLLKELAADKVFKASISSGISSTRMKDREAVLRCIAFSLLDYKKEYKGSLDSFLEKAMKKINGMSEQDITIIKNDFLSTMQLTLNVFGKANFRIPTDYTVGRINIAVMESVYNAFYYKFKFGNAINKDKAVSVFADLLGNKNYIDAVRNSTGAVKKVETRFSMTNTAFGEC